jgi:hypothetical protein
MSLSPVVVSFQTMYTSLPQPDAIVGTDAIPESNTINANDVTADLLRLCPFLTIQQMLI